MLASTFLSAYVSPRRRLVILLIALSAAASTLQLLATNWLLLAAVVWLTIIPSNSTGPALRALRMSIVKRKGGATAGINLLNLAGNSLGALAAGYAATLSIQHWLTLRVTLTLASTAILLYWIQKHWKTKPSTSSHSQNKNAYSKYAKNQETHKPHT